MDAKEMKKKIEENLKLPVNVDASESIEITSDMLIQIATVGHSTAHLIKPLEE